MLTGEARGQVALFLLLTLLPFSVLAPLIGPFLDRFRHGRRWAIDSTMALLDTIVAAVTATVFTLPTVLLLSFVVGLCQQLGKLALDATIQEHVPGDRRTSVFGRSETLIQLSWVLGGGLAVALPVREDLGMTVLAALMLGWLVWVLRSSRARGRVRAAAVVTQ